MPWSQAPYNLPSSQLKCHHCTNTLWPTVLPLDRTMPFSRIWTKNCTNIQTLKPSAVIGGMGKQEQDRKESRAIVEWPHRLSVWQGHLWTLGTHTITNRHTFPNQPAGSVGEDYVAFFICLLNESHACLFLPVAHGLLEHGPLTAWNTQILHPPFTQSLMSVWFTADRAAVQRSCLPVKFPPMT